MKRNEIKESLKWNVEKIYQTDEKFYEQAKKLEDLIDKVVKMKGHLTDDADSFYEFLQKEEKALRLLYKIRTYAHLKNDEDTRKSEYQQMDQYSQNLHSKLSEAFSFIDPEILSAPKEKIETFIEKKPELKEYKQYFDNLFRAKEHTLSEKEEKIIASYSKLENNPVNTYMLFSNADISFKDAKKDGKEVKITEANFTDLQEDENREFRKEVYENYYSSYKQFENTAASLLDGELKANNIKAKLKNFKSARQMSLFANNIDEKVYDNLIKTVNDNMDIMHDYTKLRKKVLGVDQLHFYDVYMPLVKSFDKKYSFDQAKEIVLEALKPLGDEYVEIAKKGFEDRWFDVCPNEGKRSGAYSSGCYDSDPYILLNYTNNLDSIFTVAHELGHSMHSYLTRNTQPFVYGSYSIFLAEIASTTNELLLLDYLIKNAQNTDQKAYLLNYYMHSFKSTVYRQTMFAEFEHEVNKLIWDDKPLSASILDKIYKDLNQKYFGEAMEVDDFIATEWARIPHFYMFYYVYQYATGFCSAVYFSQKILHGSDEDREKYLGFLKAGESDYALNVLKDAGLDMTNPKPLEDALNVARKTLKELEEMIG
ncbi:MAG: oligoendopeptidase F [Tissierellia bacterium]|nr:oligoendopeptidase F [Tissierellia bacterium]